MDIEKVEQEEARQDFETWTLRRQKEWPVYYDSGDNEPSPVYYSSAPEPKKNAHNGHADSRLSIADCTQKLLQFYPLRFEIGTPMKVVGEFEKYALVQNAKEVSDNEKYLPPSFQLLQDFELSTNLYKDFVFAERIDLAADNLPILLASTGPPLT